ncbi:MAG: hypothetical protein E7020_01850 [Alphaproteobacteria bacterium]|nr:hypothetical protein [Alphaproteobacteria bacterium]
MMFRRRKKAEDDVIGPSTGWIKWATRFFRFILYPFIHPLWFFIGLLVVVIALVAIPSYYGVQFGQIPQWYKSQLQKYYVQTETAIANKIVNHLKDEALKRTDELTVNAVNVKTAKRTPSKEEMVEYSNPHMANRKIFEKAQDIPVDVATTVDTLSRDNLFRFRRNDTIGLRYLEQPEDIKGVVEVVNANELRVNGILMFLYGIYVDTLSEEGVAAQRFLQNEVEGKEVICKIVAYTYDDAPTSICVLGYKSLNQQLVDLGYSMDVSLN